MTNETRMRISLADASAELKTLLDSWDYAFACGDRCAVPSTPGGRLVLQRVDDLRALIEELTP